MKKDASPPDELTRIQVQHAHFTDLVGRWIPDSDFEEIIAAQRQIDWDKWK